MTTPPENEARATPGFTPGPWRLIPYDAGDKPWRVAPMVAASDDLDCAIVHWAGFAQEHWQSARGVREILANARLIASAPDGHAFAAAFIAFIERSDTDDLDFGRGLATSGLIEQARAYLAKAEQSA